MQIILFSWRGPKHPNAGGAEISTHEHAKGWVRMGHQVMLFTSAFAGCKNEEVIDGVKIKREGRQIFEVQWKAFKWYLFDNHPKFDLVVDQFHGIPFFTPLYVKAKKLAFIHEVTKEVWQLNPWPWPFNKIAAFAGEIFEPLTFALYKNVPFMTVSQSTKKDLIAWGIPEDSIKVIHNGVNLLRFTKLPQKEKKKTVIFLGSISKDKGIEDAIYIFKQIDIKEDNWQFWIAGKSDLGYLKTIKNLAKNLGIINKIKFFGYVSEREKFKLLSKAHMLVNPSVREGWGLVVIEAAGVGTPTVGYNVTGLRDSIIDKKTGILCDPTPIKCSEAILALMLNRKYYEKLRKNCFKWSKKFSWNRSAKESLKLIKKII